MLQPSHVRIALPSKPSNGFARSSRLSHRDHESNMLTLFSIPRAFEGHFAVIQRNAIHSWHRLGSQVEIVLFGDDPGTAEICEELGLQHVPEISRNEHGTPLLDDVFRRAHEVGSRDLLCYVNADIILLDDFLSAAAKLRDVAVPFVAVGHRWDVPIREDLRFEAGWQAEISRMIRESGVQHPSSGMDYFLFSRGLLQHIPPFAVGRTVWDNWLPFHARERGARFIDATPAINIVHQNHDYGHHAQGELGVWLGPEAVENRRLAAGGMLTAADATHVLTPDGLRRRWRRRGFGRQIKLALRFHPQMGPLYDWGRRETPRLAGRLPLLTHLPWGDWWWGRVGGQGAASGLPGAGEEGAWRFFQHWLMPGMIVVDLGSGDGFIALLASSIVGNAGRVAAFESSAWKRSRFRQQLRLNRRKNVELAGADTETRFLEHLALSHVELIRIDQTRVDRDSIRRLERFIGGDDPPLLLWRTAISSESAAVSLSAYPDEPPAVSGYRWYAISVDGRLDAIERVERNHAYWLAVPGVRMTWVQAWLSSA
jgi:hypothetical protein